MNSDTIKDFFFMGGPLFMGILTFLFIFMIIWSIYHFLFYFLRKGISTDKISKKLSHIKILGLIALVTGIFAQLIGLYKALASIERAADISPGIIFGGLKVSMITTIYGIIIYLLSLVIWFILDAIICSRSN